MFLELEVGYDEVYNEETEEFEVVHGNIVQLEHSLYTISMWEASHKRNFLNNTELSSQDIFDYIQCMSYRTPFNINILTMDDLEKINSYMQDVQSATTIQSNRKSSSSSDVITSEVLYASIFELGIDISCQHWHISRLLLLLQVMSIRQNGSEKMNQTDIHEQNRRLNEMRRKQMNTKG